MGNIVKLRPSDLKGGSAMTRHQVGFSEALELGKLLGMDLPEEIHIYGIEVEDPFTFNEGCTRLIRDKLNDIIDKIIFSETLGFIP